MQYVGRPGLSSVSNYFDSLFTLCSRVGVEPMTLGPIWFHVLVGSSGISPQIMYLAIFGRGFAVDFYLGKGHKWCLVIGYLIVKTSQLCALSQNN